MGQKRHHLAPSLERILRALAESPETVYVQHSRFGTYPTVTIIGGSQGGERTNLNTLNSLNAAGLVANDGSDNPARYYITEAGIEAAGA